MTSASASESLARIDAALARIERAASAPRAAHDPDLAARHERLRRATAAAIAELDAVIGAGEG